MSADSARPRREEDPRPSEPGSRVYILAGPDGEALGTLTIDLEPVVARLGPAEALLGQVSLGAGSFDAGELRMRIPDSRAGRGPATPAIRVVLVPEDGGAALVEAEVGMRRVESPAPVHAPLARRVADYERGLIEEALRGTRGNRARAATLLQTTERILGYRIQRYGIDCAQFRKKGTRD